MGDGSGGEVEDSRALYRLPPEQFTAARDALARRLKAGGDRAEAEEIRKLRRPNAPAWALNQVAQGQPDLIEEVLSAGNDLREAMEIGDGRLLREAERSTRQASDSVVDEAERVLAGAGHSASDDVRSRLTATLRAAIVDPDLASQLQVGMLERDVELPGFGMEMPVAAPPTPKPAKPSASRPKQPVDDEERRERAARQERDEQEERERREARWRREEARRAAKRRLGELESEAKRLGRQAERLAAAADRAEEEARQARAEAASAAAEADEVAAKVAAARREVEDLDSE